MYTRDDAHTDVPFSFHLLHENQRQRLQYNEHLSTVNTNNSSLLTDRDMINTLETTNKNLLDEKSLLIRRVLERQ